MLVTLLAIRLLLWGLQYAGSFRRGRFFRAHRVGHVVLVLFILLVLNTSRLG